MGPCSSHFIPLCLVSLAVKWWNDNTYRIKWVKNLWSTEQHRLVVKVTVRWWEERGRYFFAREAIGTFAFWFVLVCFLTRYAHVILPLDPSKSRKVDPLNLSPGRTQSYHSLSKTRVAAEGWHTYFSCLSFGPLFSKCCLNPTWPHRSPFSSATYLPTISTLISIGSQPLPVIAPGVELVKAISQGSHHSLTGVLFAWVSVAPTT